MFVIVLVIIHLLICLFAYLGMRNGMLHSSPLLMILVIMIPLWGILCLGILEMRERGKREVKEEIGIEKMKINDEIYRSILVDDDTAGELIVPLQEALLMNDPRERRALMMDVMYSGADPYVDQLKEARMNDDTEVVHYAITALVEIQKEFDLKFQRLEKEYAGDPEQEGLLYEYLDLLEEYIASGVLEGNMLELQERRYSELIGKLLLERPGSRQFYIKKIRTDLRLKEYDEVYRYAGKMIEEWPDHEAGYLLMIQYFAVVGDRSGIAGIIKKLTDRQVYLSAESRSAVAFWQDCEL